MVCGILLQTPLTIVLFSRNLFHTKRIISVEKQSHTGLEAGIEGMWESGREKNEIIVK